MQRRSLKKLRGPKRQKQKKERCVIARPHRPPTHLLRIRSKGHVIGVVAQDLREIVAQRAEAAHLQVDPLNV